MRTARAFLAFLYDFLVGDDPLIAAAVVATLAVTAALAAIGVAAWWVPPTAVVAILALSVSSSIPGDARSAPKVDPRR